MRKNIFNTKGYLIEYMHRNFENEIVHTRKHFKSFYSFVMLLFYLLNDDKYFIKRIYKVS